jgi:hypothetical protein
VVRPPPKGLKKKKEKEKWVLGFLGVVQTTPESPILIFCFFFLAFWGWPNHSYGGGPATSRPAVGSHPRFSSLKKKKKDQNDVVLGWVGIIILE